MKGDCDEYVARDEKRKHRFPGGTTKEKAKALLSRALERDEKIEVYKSRLKQLETAFYYNLELISERDLELTILEKQLATESEKLQEVVRERHELEDLVKIIDERSDRKIQQLETRLSLKQEEIKDLQRANAENVGNLKRLISDTKQQEEKKIYKMSRMYETEKNDLIRRHREETEDKEMYYLFEIDSLAGKLEQVCREKDRLAAAAEEENKKLKSQLQDAERHFLEKENRYLEKLGKMNDACKRKLSREVQCDFKPEGVTKVTQARPEVATSDAQTIKQFVDPEDHYVRRIKFLQEQNEVLKCVVKDLKRNRDAEPRDPGQPPGCECSAIRTEIQQVNQKFESEVNNLKKILQEELEDRAKEDSVIQGLEASVTCLKEKLMLRLREKFNDFEGQDVCTCTCAGENRREIRVVHPEQILCMKIDCLATTAEGEMQRIHEKLEKLRKRCAEKKEKLGKLQGTPRGFRSENSLEEIRSEMKKLENKIEENVAENNCGNFPTRLEPRFSP